jgi:hypothetical protein
VPLSERRRAWLPDENPSSVFMSLCPRCSMPVTRDFRSCLRDAGRAAW